MVLSLHGTQVVDPELIDISVKKKGRKGLNTNLDHRQCFSFYCFILVWGEKTKLLPSLIPTGPVFSYLWPFENCSSGGRNSSCEDNPTLWAPSVYYIRSCFLKTGLNFYNQLVITLQQDSFFFLDSSKTDHPLPKCCWKGLSLKFSLEGIHWFGKTLVQGQKNCLGNKSSPFCPLAILVKEGCSVLPSCIRGDTAHRKACGSNGAFQFLSQEKGTRPWKLCCLLFTCIKKEGTMREGNSGDFEIFWFLWCRVFGPQSHKQ